LRPAAATPERIAAVRQLSLTSPETGAVGLEFDKLRRDPDALAAFNADPLIYRGKIPARTATETIDAIGEVTAKLSKVTLPTPIMHGTADQIADPAGSQILNDHVGSSDRTLKRNDALWHQLFNEPERKVVLADLTRWLQLRI
jgi:alpha-beta hydrolase superfamily lysophospholipase